MSYYTSLGFSQTPPRISASASSLAKAAWLDSYATRSRAILCARITSAESGEEGGVYDLRLRLVQWGKGLTRLFPRR